jgi:hypothetical protein
MHREGTVGDEAPKSAFELAMERLRKKDQEAGTEERRLTDEQRAAIADVKKVYEARLAEREILHKSQLARTADPEARAALEMEYRRDRERVVSERDRKLEEARAEGSGTTGLDG